MKYLFICRQKAIQIVIKVLNEVKMSEIYATGKSSELRFKSLTQKWRDVMKYRDNFFVSCVADTHEEAIVTIGNIEYQIKFNFMSEFGLDDGLYGCTLSITEITPSDGKITKDIKSEVVKSIKKQYQKMGCYNVYENDDDSDSESDSESDCGFCEICGIDYDDCDRYNDSDKAGKWKIENLTQIWVKILHSISQYIQEAEFCVSDIAKVTLEGVEYDVHTIFRFSYSSNSMYDLELDICKPLKGSDDKFATDKILKKIIKLLQKQYIKVGGIFGLDQESFCNNF